MDYPALERLADPPEVLEDELRPARHDLRRRAVKVTPQFEM